MIEVVLNAAELWLTWMIHAAWQAALLAAAVFVLTRLMGRRLDPRWRFALWLVVFARLAVPVLPAAPWSVFGLVPSAAMLNPAGHDAAPVVLPSSMAAVETSRAWQSNPADLPADARFELDSGRSETTTDSRPSATASVSSPEPEIITARHTAAAVWLVGVRVLILRLAATHIPVLQ